MKKALALVLALVLALSMAVSAFAADLVILDKVTATEEKLADIKIVNPFQDADGKPAEILYTSVAGTYYIALDNKPWKDIKLTTNGNLSAELVKYDPLKHNVIDMEIVWNVVDEKGETVDTIVNDYKAAVAKAKELNDAAEVTYYSVKLATNVNIIKITVADNYGVAYTSGSLKIEAKLNKVAYAATLKLINDVTIFEYEEVKWTAQNFGEDLAFLDAGNQKGYSDYFTAENGYGKDYNYNALREWDDAAVISTTAFRAIAGEDIVVKSTDMTVTIEDIAAGQKGVNFKSKGLHTVDKDKDGDVDALAFGFYGKQVINSKFTVELSHEYSWYDLRELFGYKVEEDDIVTFYLLKDGKVIKEYKVDFMTVDYNEEAEIAVELSNTTLGNYELVLEVPAAEGTETNPNTGAESVVGVVAALAVVSLASAAAVSLKK